MGMSLPRAFDSCGCAPTGDGDGEGGTGVVVIGGAGVVVIDGAGSTVAALSITADALAPVLSGARGSEV